MSVSARRLARLSLVLLWLLTSVVSLLGREGASLALLHESGLPQPWFAGVLWAGLSWDALCGLALWRWHRRSVYLCAGIGMFGMTLAASLLLPGLWLDPLGSLSKNLPIAALLYLLYLDAPVAGLEPQESPC